MCVSIHVILVTCWLFFGRKFMLMLSGTRFNPSSMFVLLCFAFLEIIAEAVRSF